MLRRPVPNDHRKGIFIGQQVSRNHDGAADRNRAVIADAIVLADGRPMSGGAGKALRNGRQGFGLRNAIDDTIAGFGVLARDRRFSGLR